MTARVPQKGEIKFHFVAEMSEWRARMSQNHWGRGASIEEALDDLSKTIEEEARTVKRARAGLRAAP